MLGRAGAPWAGGAAVAIMYQTSWYTYALPAGNVGGRHYPPDGVAGVPSRPIAVASRRMASITN